MTLIEEKQKRTLIHNALDLCTGSGCIALSLKKMFPNAEVYGSDISPYAISVAQENADFNKLEIYLALSDYLTYFVNRKMSFDLIVSNPPYIKDDEILDSSLGYEPQLALFGGKDGLDAYKRIFADLPSVLNVHGVCYLEIEASNAQETLMLAEEMLRGFKAEILKDLEQKDRFLRLVRVS
jgi:release factor glutamine methyltransferase